jgi:ribonuclease HI
LKVELFSDGACSGNPGPGGYGVILRAMGKEKEISGFEPETTNNRMELRGVIEGLKALKYPCDVTVTTDSRYVCDGINKGWAKSWKAKGWKKSDGKPALNTDLWDELLALTDIHNVSFKWVKGHNSHTENERCDRLAVAAIENHKLRNDK